MVAVKSLALFLIATLAAALVRAETFSVKDWQSDARLALSRGDRKALAKLSDLGRLEKKALSRGDQGDRESLRQARRLFAQGRLEESVRAYDRIDKDSDFWLEAVEEKGWAFHRLNQPEKAIAQTKTLLSPAFLPIVGSEPFFLRALTELKICDYKEVLETNRSFKDSQRSRVVALQDLAAAGSNAASETVVKKADRFPLTLKDVGEEAKSLPRLFYRDREFQKALLTVKLAEAVQGLRAEGLSVKPFAKIEGGAKKARETLRSRLRSLAGTETAENFAMIQKLNLIEVETVQRLHADRNLDKDAFSKGRFRQASMDELVFPDDGHPWMDELDKFEVKADVCPQNLRRRM